MATNIFDDINASDIATYWTTLQQQEAPYLGEILFPSTRIPTSDVTWFRGQTSAPVPLAPSAFDTKTSLRGRDGYTKQSVHANYFKEGKYIDEAMRQQLLTVANSPIQGQKDIILNRIFNDDAQLIRGAALTREILRMQLLQTGKYSIAGNKQIYADDYQMKATHQATAAKAWNADGATPIDDIRKAKDVVGADTDQTITRAIMNQKTFDALLANEQLKSTILANNANTALATVPQTVLLQWIQAEYGLTIQVYDKSYTGSDGAIHRFLDDGNVVFMPDGDLGSTSFAPTPEETDLLASTSADVSIVDGGVAVTTTLETDPVTKMVRVSQNFVPTFENIDGVYVLKSFSSASGSTTQPTGGTTNDGGGTKPADDSKPADNTPKTVAVTGVTLDQTTANGTVGGTAQLKATVAPADATNTKVTFKSSDETVATVDGSGKVTFVKAGTAKVTATTDDGAKTADCTFTIADKPAADAGTGTTTPPEA
ncbi:major capsid protein [Lacticaseibacillus zhaodongensis]|uniref:major capsid protein n=1 Tax=Lacticaseibacillus zhaodongensis TaxID=2668065 RepID=UPI0012D320D7|nr:major capsid protein [Lacticaseibacillus zhaodongensis]